ncbi:MAG: hypothetical protein K0Q61_3247 [Rhodococcus erythropolis]|nr:hypothetical protein [Rhodococcus erythropolis]
MVKLSLGRALSRPVKEMNVSEIVVHLEIPIEERIRRDRSAERHIGTATESVRPSDDSP